MEAVTPAFRPFFVLLLIFLNFSPSIMAWVMNRNNSKMFKLRRILIINLLTGWTGVGWVALWGYVLYKISKVVMAAERGGRPAAWNPGPAPAPGTPESTGRRPCGGCGGSGRATCGACGGTRGQYSHPTTEHGTAQWNPCNACYGSGTVPCTSCGGSGSVW